MKRQRYDRQKERGEGGKSETRTGRRKECAPKVFRAASPPTPRGGSLPPLPNQANHFLCRPTSSAGVQTDKVRWHSPALRNGGGTLLPGCGGRRQGLLNCSLQRPRPPTLLRLDSRLEASARRNSALTRTFTYTKIVR